MIFVTKGVVFLQKSTPKISKGNGYSTQEVIASGLPNGVLTASNSMQLRNATSAVSNVPMPSILSGGTDNSIMENLNFSKIMGNKKKTNNVKLRL